MQKHVQKGFFFFVIVTMLITALGGNVSEARAATAVFVNEIHYDNASTDIGEAVEVAGSAGTDLSGWSLVLYNGNNGAVYNTINLSGSIPDQDDGYGTLSFLTAGLQNGAPDGLALVDDSNAVIQFLSYEGSFTAVGGAANGMTSTDIGVAETSSTPAGDSLQLTGTGTQYEDFSWAASTTSETFGTVNTGQDFTGAFTPDIVLNEFQADPATDISGDANGDGIRDASDDEFVELVNISGSNLDISGWTLSDGVGVKHTFPNNTVIPADCGIVVFGGGTPTGTFGNVQTQTASSGALYLNNSGDSIIVNDGTNNQVNYTYGSEGGNNQSLTLNPDISGTSFVEHSTATGSGGSLFSPGTQIDGTSFSGCSASPSASVIINEVDADTAGTDTEEFIELYDGGLGNTSLDGMTLVFFNGSDDQSYNPGGHSNAIDLNGYSTDANGYFVLGNTAVSSASITFSNNSLQNGADAVALFAADGTDFPNDTPVTTTNLIDALVYDTSDSDDPGLLALLNASQPQVNENSNDSPSESNQRCPNGAGGERNTSSYEQYPPTPGSENICVNIATNIIINEVDADTAGTDTEEFIELYDGGTGNTALDGLVLVTFNGSDHQSYNLGGHASAIDLDGYSTDANGYFVLGNTAVSGASITFSNNSLQNGADAVALYQGDGSDFPNDTAITTTNLLDALVYDTNDSDNPALLALLNAGEPQVNEASNNSASESNQRCPDGSGGQRNTSTYAQYSPTAGAANSCANIDLELSKTVDDNNPDEGDTITYTLTVSNTSSDQDATNVVVRDYLPDTTTEVSNVTPGVCSSGSISTVSANTLEWTVGTVSQGGSASCDISVDIRAGTDGIILTNNAEVYAVTENTDIDSSPGNFSTSPSEDDEASQLVSVGLPAACGTPATLISTVQGSGAASPLVGSTVTIEGIVVGDFQTANHLRGFFVQEEDADMDANSTTSEGIFVYDGATPAVDVAEGDLVRVTGTVAEYHDLTEVTSVSEVLPCGNGTTTAASITLPVSSPDVWEQHEGMLITIPQTLYVTGNYNQGRYGEVELSAGGRLDIPTNVVSPGAAAIAMSELNSRSRIQLEDGSTAQNPDPAPYIGAGNTLRAGDTIPGLTGVLHYSYNLYEVHPTTNVSFTRVNNREATPPATGGTIRVASFNVLNYFSTIDTGSPSCGPSGTLGCRGADTLSEFNRQRDKIINAIITMDADVIGLMEMENHPTDDALQNLIDGLNASAGAGTYAAVSTGTIGTDAIKVALIYKVATVTPVNSYAILDSSVDPTFLDTYNRPSLAQTFAELASGEKFTVVVNHLKSKGSACDAVGDPDTGDGQGNCNLTRTSAATALVNWLGTDPTSSNDPDFLIIGDMNAYAKEDPIAAITDGSFVNLVNHFIGTGAYSYTYDGEKGYLDHALSSTNLKAQVTGVVEWHINSAEPSALDYNDYNQAYLYSSGVYRASDHDPVIVGLALGSPPTVLYNTKTIPENNAKLTTGPTQVFVEFNKDVKSDGSLQAANNVANYLLVEALGDGFQTTNCAAGIDPADAAMVVNSASYSNTDGYIATLNINNGVALPSGEYRLYICGTTSIEDLSGLELNGGFSDSLLQFSVGSVAAGLPDTGFAPGEITKLAAQPDEKAYTETTMTLEIPVLGVKMPIVGVPLTSTGWDVTWLGNSAGYLEGTAFPTWRGNTVLTGHVWSSHNLPGPFVQLRTLRYGDRLYLRAWGQTYVYEVRDTGITRPNQVDAILQHEEYDWLTLVTCEDYQSMWSSYSFRRVVRAVLVEVQ